VVISSETKLEITRNVYADIRCCNEFLTEMKKARIQRTVDSFFKKTCFAAIKFCTLYFFNKMINIVNTFLKFNSIHVCIKYIAI
jgi:hypothetical protein